MGVTKPLLWLFASVGVVALVAAAVVGTLYVSGFWEDDKPPIRIVPAQQQPSEPFLTGGEAAAKANAKVREGVSEAGRSDLSVACDADEYNSQTRNWIVLCIVAGPQNSLELWYKVDGLTGLTVPIN